MADLLRSRWDRVGDVVVHSRASSGSSGAARPPIVLVHGLVVSSRYMVPTAELLAADYPVYVVDMPGFGRSGKPRRVMRVPELAESLAGWMRLLGLSRSVVVANSFGCQVAVELGVRHPELVDREVLVGPSIDARARNPLVQVGRWLRAIFQERLSLWPIMVKDALEAGPRRGLLTFRYALQYRLDRRLPLLLAPTLVVRGSRDVLVPRGWALEAASILPRGRYVEVAGAPHAINYSAPEDLAALVQSFVREDGAGGLRRAS